MTSRRKNGSDYAEVRRLEEEIHATRLRMRALHSRASYRSSTMKGIQDEIDRIKRDLQQRKRDLSLDHIFQRCCGVIVDQGNANVLSLRFTPTCFGCTREEYRLVLKRLPTKQWMVGFCDLPFSIKFLPDQVLQANITSKNELCKLVRRINHQVQAHAMRSEQFRMAEVSFKSSKIQLYPAYNTLYVLAHILLSDVAVNDEYSVKVVLSYKPDTILPEEVSFKFDGGCEESHSEFKKVMSILQKVSLVDALQEVFPDVNESDHSVLSDLKVDEVDSEASSVSVLRPLPPRNTRSSHQSKQVNNRRSVMKGVFKKRGRPRGKSNFK